MNKHYEDVCHCGHDRVHHPGLEDCVAAGCECTLFHSEGSILRADETEDDPDDGDWT